ncbi:MAG: hypothetical protein WBH47_26785, partial [Streptosporangiaceae bacterium]
MGTLQASPSGRLAAGHCSRRCGQPRRAALLAGALAVVAVTVAGCGVDGSGTAAASSGVIAAVGAENEYANVLGQVGGKYVHVSAILDNPNT